MEDKFKEPEQQWTSTSNKRYRNKESPEICHRAKKQTFIKDYWLLQETTIPTSNSFDPLNQDNVKEDEELNNQSSHKKIKAPPIFVSGVQNIKPLQKLLDNIAQGCYTLKILNNDQVKIQSNKSEKYLPIITALKEKNTEFFTYQRKENRNFKVVLRNLHPSVEIQEIKEELKAKGHNVLRINNIIQRISKKPLPLFFVELENKENNKEIYKIDLLLYSKVIFEQPYKKREIPQCMRCQQYGHTKSYCYKTPRCVKCAENHLTQNCPRKAKSSGVTCTNCGENHPANYRGCVVFKQLRSKMFPTLRKKNVEEVPPTAQTSNVTGKISQLGSVVQPGISYAQKARGAHPRQQDVNPVPAVSNNQHTSKLEEMIMQLITKMDSMFNLLAAMIAKMP